MEDILRKLSDQFMGLEDDVIVFGEESEVDEMFKNEGEGKIKGF